MSNRSYKLAIAIRSSIANFTFNSPWECRIGLTGRAIGIFEAVVIDFQFPVGMSNRSYSRFAKVRGLFKPTFNSPWECRIGLTGQH